MNRRGFFKLLAAALAMPLARKVLPASVQTGIQDRINAEMTAAAAKYSKAFADAFFTESPFMAKLREHYPEGFSGGDYVSSSLTYTGEGDA